MAGRSLRRVRSVRGLFGIGTFTQISGIVARRAEPFPRFADACSTGLGGAFRADNVAVGHYWSPRYGMHGGRTVRRSAQTGQGIAGDRAADDGGVFDIFAVHSYIQSARHTRGCELDSPQRLQRRGGRGRDSRPYGKNRHAPGYRARSVLK